MHHICQCHAVAIIAIVSCKFAHLLTDHVGIGCDDAHFSIRSDIGSSAFLKVWVEWPLENWFVIQ